MIMKQLSIYRSSRFNLRFRRWVYIYSVVWVNKFPKEIQQGNLAFQNVCDLENIFPARMQ